MQSQNRKRAPAWTEWEVLDLIAVWGEESVLSELHSKRRNAKTFQKISDALRDRGYNRDTTHFRVKLKELRQAYQKTKESNGCSGTEPQTCRFYSELHAILGGAATTTPPLYVNSNDGVLPATPEDIVDGEDEEEEEDVLGESTQHTILPNSQDLFITLTEIPSQPNKAREGTSVEQLQQEKLKEPYIGISHRLLAHSFERSKTLFSILSASEGGIERGLLLPKPVI
ncbi:Zinc finger and SCAN domain-containing protein 29 [Chelonia mydas]|uniref:Zinc finger and SCAN domain-containing protein 29 n=1 Tax=Chelonia mydas TaxID=8469 RepID=M7BLB8_CHEMY|nr:Zinc finger and SCAN domain-containing protein 29 [Chelonia mydas]